MLTTEEQELRIQQQQHWGETSIFSKKGPFCKALLGPKRDPFVRQNFKCGPLSGHGRLMRLIE